MFRSQREPGRRRRPPAPLGISIEQAHQLSIRPSPDAWLAQPMLGHADERMRGHSFWRQDTHVTEIEWPRLWQEEAKVAITPYFGRDCRLRIIVDDPATAIVGTVLEGFLYLDGGIPTVIYDHSGRRDVYPWALLSGPVLRIYELVPRRKPLVVYAHPDWSPRHGQ